MGALMRAFDWSQTPIGPVEHWPQSLRTALGILLNSGYPMYIAWGAEFTQLYNDAYRPILGATKHPGALGRSTLHTFPELWEFIGPMFQEVMARGTASTYTDQLLALDRNGFIEECYFTFSYSAILHEAGGVGGVFVTVLETTERVLRERRLRTTRDLSTVPTRHGPAAICEASTAILSQNPHDLPFALLYRCEEDRAVLVGATGLIDRALIPATLTEHDRSAWPFSPPNGGIKPRPLKEFMPEVPSGPWPEPVTETVCVPIILVGHEQAAAFLVAGVSPRLAFDTAYEDFFRAVAFNIATAFAEAEAYEHEHRRAEALAEIDRAKTVFFSNISHEFRTPLTLMLGPLEDLLTRPDRVLASEDRGQLEVIHRNGLRLLKLVNTLLDFSRIEAGRLQATYEPLDLAVYTADLASVFRSAIERAGLRLRVECPPLPDVVYVDRDMWEKIVLNLLSNAVKFTFEGEISVSLHWGEGQLELRVRDTGTGIPAEELPHIFARFHRVRGARARTQEGTGIGLAFVQELVRLHGGQIMVASEVGVGTAVTVVIPTGTAHLPSDRIGATHTLAPTVTGAEAYIEETLGWLPTLPLVSAPSSALSAVSPRILVADDNADMRLYLQRVLSPHWQVETVVDGMQALAVAREHLPALVLADVMMPGLDGFALLRALRTDPRTATIPVLLLSARAGEEARLEGLAAGADDYLVKPFAARELLARIEAHLQLKRLRDETETALRESEQQYRQLVQAIPVAIYTCDTQGRITLYNEAAATLWGREPEPGKGLWCGSWRMYHPDGSPLPANEGPMAITIGEGRSVRGQEIIIERPDGTYRHVLPYPEPLRNVAGELVGAVNILVDITEHRQAEVALRELNATLEQRVTERTALLALIQQVTRAANETPSSAAALQAALDSLCAYTGWPLGHVYLTVAPGAARWAPTSLWHLDAPERYHAFQAATQAQGVVVAGTDLVGRVGATGQPVWLQAVATDPAFSRRHAAEAAGLSTGVGWPVLVGNEVAGVLEFYTPAALAPNPALLEALTQIGTQLGRAVERERAALQAQQQREALLQREKLAAMSTLLASVAHELNNPLASIVLHADLVRDEVADDGPLAEPLAVIAQAAARCERLVRQFLTLARQHPPVRTVVDLHPLVTETLGLLAYPLQVDRITVHLDFDLQVPLLWGDPHQLQQVLLNLLTNAQQALRAAPGARRLTLHTQYEPRQETVTLAVMDNGPGIPPALQPRIFEPFFTTKPPGVGTGLGLPLCRGIAEAHGGSLEVTSGPGPGATLCLTLPVTSVPANTLAPPKPLAAVTGSCPGQTILVVDDEGSLASGLARLLRRDGHTVDTVANGLLALERVAARPYDLVLCDVRMPELDGPSLYRLVARQQPQLGQRFIFLTGDTLEPATMSFLEATGVPCLMKPFRIADVRRIIERITALNPTLPELP